MTITERTVTGHVAERVERVRCEECLEDYDVRLRALGSARGARDDADALGERAQASAERHLERLAAVEPCPRCGAFQPGMVERMFREPRHLSLRRRYDQSPGSVNSPYARARRLHARGTSVDDVRRLIEVEPAWDTVWAGVLTAFATDETYTARRGALAARLASCSEGERLAHHLLRRRRMTPRDAARALVTLYGLPDGAARSLVLRAAGERSRAEGSLGLVAVGLLVLVAGGALAFILGVAVPFVRAMLDPPKPDPDLRLVWPTPVHFRIPAEREGRGVHPVPVGPLPMEPRDRR